MEKTESRPDVTPPHPWTLRHDASSVRGPGSVTIGPPGPPPVHQTGARARARTRVRRADDRRVWGVTSVRFASGHELALRVLPVDDAPAATVLHRPPEPKASRRDGAEPGPPPPSGAHAPEPVSIPADVSWNGGPLVRVRAPEAGLDWILRLRASRLTRLLDRHLAVADDDHGAATSLRARLGTLADHVLGAPDLVRAVRVVGASRAVLDGRDLGASLPGPPARDALGALAPALLLVGEPRSAG